MPMMGGFMMQGVSRGQNQGQGQRGGRGGGRGRGNMGGQMNQGVPGYPLNIKYNPNVRNQQVPSQQTSEIPPMVMTEDRKQQIGEALYPMIQTVLRAANQEEQTGKITGMVLESMDQPELMQLLESPEAVTKKVNEALQVLASHAAIESKSSTTTTATQEGGN